MKKKNILNNCLIFGFNLLFLVGCYQLIDYRVTGEWEIINNSNSKVEIIANIYSNANQVYKVYEKFTLTPGEKFYYSNVDTGPENVKPENYMPQIRPSDFIIINDVHKYELRDVGLLYDIQSYKADRIGYNHYKFTYTFTDEIIEQIINSGK